MTDILVGAATIVIAGIAAFIAWRQAQEATRQTQEATKQAQEARRTREVTALLPLYQTHESSDFAEVRQMIHRAATKPGSVNVLNEVERNEPLKLQLRAYINHLNFVCIMVKEGLVSETYARTIFEAPIINCQRSCSGYIQKVRDEENPSFALELPQLGRPEKEAPKTIELLARALDRDPLLGPVQVTNDRLVVTAADGKENWELKAHRLT